jgi:hypothetical protein
MIFNGPDAHPLARYLRKNAQKLYDFEMFGANKTIPFGVFKVEGESVHYYTGEKLK